jgi:hypothetical protein
MLYLPHVIRQKVCRRCISRQQCTADANLSIRDLLQRHYTVHGRDANQQEIPAVNGMIPKSAGRTPIACSNCAKTKTKCDKKFPCSRCAGRNLKCTLRPTRRSSKNATRMGLVVPPEGLSAMPPHNVPVVNGENGQTQTPVLKHSLLSSPQAPRTASTAYLKTSRLPLFSTELQHNLSISTTDPHHLIKQT